MISESYMKTRDQTKDTTMLKISDKDFQTMTFSYIRGLQDFVISAVKHSDNGSADFEVLYLNNFHKQKSVKLLRDIFVNEFKLSPALVAKMFAVVTWAKQSMMLDGCKAFLRLYNKGVTPTNIDQITGLEMHEKFIQENTFFGQMMQPIYDLRQQAEENKNIVSVELIPELSFEQFSPTNSPMELPKDFVSF